MFTYEASAIAIRGSAKAIRAALLDLGMRRCSIRLVQRQAEAPQAQLDWYGLFVRWFTAIWRANRPGAEFLFEDFRARVAGLRAEDDLSASDLDAQLERCEGEHSDIIKCVFRHDYSQIKREIAEDIAAKRRLLAMYEAREQAEAKAASRAA